MSRDTDQQSVSQEESRTTSNANRISETEPTSLAGADGSEEATVVGRRRFLRSAAAGIVGVAGGIAATETAAARNSKKIEVSSTSNYWEYQIHTKRGNDALEKGAQADAGDKIKSYGQSIYGQVDDGGIDGYWREHGDPIQQILVEYDEYGYLNIDFTTSTIEYNGITLQRDQNPAWPGYDYSIEVAGSLNRSEEMDPNDSITSNNLLRGTILPDGVDGVLSTGPPIYIFIDDPDSPGVGLAMNLEV